MHACTSCRCTGEKCDPWRGSSWHCDANLASMFLLACLVGTFLLIVIIRGRRNFCWRNTKRLLRRYCCMLKSSLVLSTTIVDKMGLQTYRLNTFGL